MVNSPEKLRENLPLAWNYMHLCGDDELKYNFQFWKILLKPIKALENSNVQTYPHGSLFYSERTWLQHEKL